MGKIASKKVEYDNHLFDSETEYRYYLHLKEDPNVAKIELQPQYVLMDGFAVECRECRGTGEGVSERTGKKVMCRRCKGLGVKDRQAWSYKADFLITYKSGGQDVVDVKGFITDRFRLTRKMFEFTTGKELVVIMWDKKKGWVKK